MSRLIDATLTARAHAVFSSNLASGSFPDTSEVVDAIRFALRTYHGPHGCLEYVASAYGDHPETAAPRMLWAREVAALCGPRLTVRSPQSTRHRPHATSRTEQGESA